MVPIGLEPLNRLVSEIFSIKVADTRIDFLSETNREPECSSEDVLV